MQIVLSIGITVVTFLVIFLTIRFFEYMKKVNNNKKKNYFEVNSTEGTDIIHIFVGNCNTLQGSYINKFLQYVRQNNIKEGRFIIDFKNESFIAI